MKNAKIDLDEIDRRILASLQAHARLRNVELAEQVGRKVLPIGRRMISNIRTAVEVGCLKYPQDLVISIKEANQFPPDQVLILATGSQGEPMAALSRMAVNEFKGLQVEEGDMVILSARVIPGNEKLISNLVNHFYRRGAHVYDSRSACVTAATE